MNTLLYLSFGGGRHQYEVAYSLATLAQFTKCQCVGDLGRVVLVTDTPDFFCSYVQQIEIESVTSSTVADWIGGNGHFFRGRVKAMQWMMSKQGGKLLVVDGDTYFTRSPVRLFSRISRGRTVMYEPECAFADTAIVEYDLTGKVLDELKLLRLKDGRSLPCGSRTMQWNAGILGLCQDDASRLDDVLTVLDTLHPLLHGVWSTEQTSFSIVFGEMTRIHLGCDRLFHYNSHPDRVKFDQRIPEMLVSSSSLDARERAVRLYASRLRRSPQRMLNHLAKRFIVAGGLWNEAMRLKAALGRRSGGASAAQ